MKLTLVEHRSKIEDGKSYTADKFSVGTHYTVERFVMTYPDGDTQTNIYVYTEYEDRKENHLPEIYYRDDWFEKHDPKFEIQTTSYGALSPEEIRKVIAGYEEAMKVVEVLTETFIK